MKQSLSKKDIKQLNELVERQFGVIDFFSKKDAITLVDNDAIMRDNVPLFFYVDKLLAPFLKFILSSPFLQHMKTCVVDMGAVKFVCGGADIMRPGITVIDERIKKDDIIAIIDERNKKPLAVVQALYDAAEMQEMSAGKVLRNIHWIGDSRWKA